jgi:RNA polymerase sigma-70 factor (ECF subfamily)
MEGPREGVDLSLLAACRDGDRDAFGMFYARHREGILAYFARRVHEPEVAADLMAETFASALVVVVDPRRPLPQTPVAWMYTIARNLLVDALRRGTVDAAARRRLGLEPLELDDDDLNRIAEISAAAELLEGAPTLLPEHEWEILRARVLDEEPYADLALRLRCSEAVVRKRVSRAKARLRATLGGNGV